MNWERTYFGPAVVIVFVQERIPPKLDFCQFSRSENYLFCRLPQNSRRLFSTGAVLAGVQKVSGYPFPLCFPVHCYHENGKSRAKTRAEKIEYQYYGPPSPSKRQFSAEVARSEAHRTVDNRRLFPRFCLTGGRQARVASKCELHAPRPDVCISWQNPRGRNFCGFSPQ